MVCKMMYVVSFQNSKYPNSNYARSRFQMAETTSDVSAYLGHDARSAARSHGVRPPESRVALRTCYVCIHIYIYIEITVYVVSVHIYTYMLTPPPRSTLGMSAYVGEVNQIIAHFTTRITCPHIILNKSFTY